MWKINNTWPGTGRSPMGRSGFEILSRLLGARDSEPRRVQSIRTREVYEHKLTFIYSQMVDSPPPPAVEPVKNLPGGRGPRFEPRLSGLNGVGGDSCELDSSVIGENGGRK